MGIPMGVYAFFVLTGFVLCCLQTHPFFPTAPAGIRPDFILILVVYFSSRVAVDMCLGAVVVSLLGYGLGMLSGAPFGLYAFTYLAVYLLIRKLKRIIEIETLAFLVVLSGVCGLVKEALIWFVLNFFSSTPYRAIVFKQMVLPQLLFTVLVAPFVLLALHKGGECLTTGHALFALLKRRMFTRTPQS